MTVERVLELDEKNAFALRLNEEGNGDFFRKGDVFMFFPFKNSKQLHRNDYVASLVNGQHWLIEELNCDLVDKTDSEWEDRMFYSIFRAGYRKVKVSDTVEMKGVFKCRNSKNRLSWLLFGFPKGELSRRIPIKPQYNRDLDKLRVQCGHKPLMKNYEETIKPQAETVKEVI